MSEEKRKPRLTPEQNEARQAARAEKREVARDARTVATLAVAIFAINADLTVCECVSDARIFLAEAYKQIRKE